MKHSVKRHAIVSPHDNTIVLIPLTQGKQTIVDALVYDCLPQFNWFAEFDKRSGMYVACRREYTDGKSKRILLHREIIGSGINIDHENGDPLDNRGQNIRKATVKENSRNRKTPNRNTSGYKGVWWRKEKQRWVATIRVDNRHIYVGSSKDKEVSARMYDRKAIEFFGEFARTNFPRSDYE